jgi:hypothetical protein
VARGWQTGDGRLGIENIYPKALKPAVSKTKLKLRKRKAKRKASAAKRKLAENQLK